MSKTTEVTDIEKRIYNKYLAISRSSVNKPFKLRKDFTKFEEDKNYIHVHKLSYFFKKYPHVDQDDFFKAPYDIYTDTDTVFDLKFYTSQRALKVYTMYIQKRRVQHPDTDDQLFSIKKSLEYILTFCTKNKISVSEYTDHATGDIPTYIKHIKHGNVNVYTMFGFANFESTLKSVPVDILKFTLGDIYQNIPRLRTNFQSSKLAKVFISAGINKITTAIKR
jgi:hypothetical protein